MNYDVLERTKDAIKIRRARKELTWKQVQAVSYQTIKPFSKIFISSAKISVLAIFPTRIDFISYDLYVIFIMVKVVFARLYLQTKSY